MLAVTAPDKGAGAVSEGRGRVTDAGLADGQWSRLTSGYLQSPGPRRSPLRTLEAGQRWQHRDSRTGLRRSCDNAVAVFRGFAATPDTAPGGVTCGGGGGGGVAAARSRSRGGGGGGPAATATTTTTAAATAATAAAAAAHPNQTVERNGRGGWRPCRG